MRALRAAAAAVALALPAGACSQPPSTPSAAGVGTTTTVAAATEAEPAGPPLSFVGRDGSRLVVDGKPWRFVGYNLPCANPFVMEEAELDHYLDVVREESGANVVRAWFFQSNGGPGNWEPFDRVLAAFGRHGIRVVPALTNQWNGGCDEGAGPEKTLDWYQGGYRVPDAGHELSFRDFAVRVAERYADDPTIAFWQLVNEAQANTLGPQGQLACDPAPARLALRSFADDVTAAVKAVDGHHLVSLGTIGGNQCGLAGREAYQYVHAGAVDLCEYHDYGASAAPLPGGPDQLAQRLQDCATLPGGPKPLFVGEAGIQGNVRADGGPEPCTPWPGCSPDQLSTDSLLRRATFFDAKIRAGVGAGVVGYLVWVKSPYYSASGDIYAIGDDDPTEGALRQASTWVAGL